MKDNLNNFQLSVESDPGLLCFSLTSLCDWSRWLHPYVSLSLFLPISHFDLSGFGFTTLNRKALWRDGKLGVISSTYSTLLQQLLQFRLGVSLS